MFPVAVIAPATVNVEPLKVKLPSPFNDDVPVAVITLLSTLLLIDEP